MTPETKCYCCGTPGPELCEACASFDIEGTRAYEQDLLYIQTYDERVTSKD